MSSVPDRRPQKSEPEPQSDEALARALRTTRDMQYLEEIWRRHGRSVYVRALRILRNQADAEDVTSETFIRAHREIVAGKYQENCLAAWLRTVAKRMSLNVLLKPENKRRADLTRATGLPSGAITSDSAGDVASTLDQLSDEQRITLKLFYFQGLTYEEIADAEGWSLNDVKSFAQNGRRMFEKIWRGRENGTGTSR
jgi:RNA polymerase sigma-70 factor (ECF subfamily)